MRGTRHCNLRGGCGAKGMAPSNLRVPRYYRGCCLGQWSWWFLWLNRTHCAMPLATPLGYRGSIAQKARAKVYNNRCRQLLNVNFFNFIQAKQYL